MDKLFDTYKQIVDRAILLGLLSEESKPYYLSACDEEAASDCTFKASKSGDLKTEHEQLQAILDEARSVYRDNSGELTHNLSPEGEFNRKETQAEENADCKDQTPVSGRSIENYSILDINNLIEMANSICSDSELSDILKVARNISLRDSPANKLSQVRRKPKKNEVVDFKIPIYLDINRKKMSTKASKVKRRFSFHEKGRANKESPLPRYKCEKEQHEEKVIDKKAFQTCKPQYCSMIPRVNLTKSDKNTSKMRKYVSNIYDPEDCEFKFTNKSVLETSSPKKMQHNECYSGDNPALPTFPHCIDIGDLESSVRITKSATNIKVNKESVDDKERFTTAFKKNYERESDERSKQGSKYAQYQSSSTRRMGFRSSPDVSESKIIGHSSKCDDNRYSKYTKEYNHFEKPAWSSGDSSWKESIDSETKEHSSQKLLNVNVICHFYSHDSSEEKKDSKNSQTFSQLEQTKIEKDTSTEQQEQPSQEKATRKSKTKFLSKLFSRNRMH